MGKEDKVADTKSFKHLHWKMLQTVEKRRKPRVEEKKQNEGGREEEKKRKEVGMNKLKRVEKLRESLDVAFSLI